MAKPSVSKKVRAAGTRRKAVMTLEEAEKNMRKRPYDASAWRTLGIIQMRKGLLNDAVTSLKESDQLKPDHQDTLAWLGYVNNRLGNQAVAAQYLDKVLDQNSNHIQALIAKGALCFDGGKYSEALDIFYKVESLRADNVEALEYQAHALLKMSRYEEGIDVYHRLIDLSPNNLKYWNGAGTAYRDLGDFEKLVTYYKKAIELSKSNPVPFANLLTSVHYSPDWSGNEITAFCKEWQSRYAPNNPPDRPVPHNLSLSKKLRIGMFSDGFRSHPVGNMIIEAVECLHSEEMEVYFYPTHSEEDHLTKRFKKIAKKWKPVKHLSMEVFAQEIRNDEIDILIDMSGHNSGSRSYSVALQPAPLLVKWVGGLINTTGIEAMDYLLSDCVETPLDEDIDQAYVEKLVRLPDDYIVYHIPRHVPPIQSLPAEDNGYITLGCFNNPTKLNKELLQEWASLMHALPASRLFLKNKPYTSEQLCERIYTILEEAGIERERVLIEGPATHLKLLEAYNKVDIALDPWPYSGGLTTCESLLMGVPVVTLPGPTFAGRHSATHLVNAGLPELVVNSWEEYRARVVELASDLESLATIRTHLRDILKQSPVCDGRRFAKHLMITLRAIWQRYCEGKAPEALTFNKEGQAWFKDESKPIDIVVKEVASKHKRGFSWDIKGQVVTIDNACKVLRNRALSVMVKTRAFAIIAFDPQSLVQKPEVYENSDNIQLFQHALLGDGQPATLHASMTPTLSSTLKPLPAEQQPLGKRDGTRLLTTLPINTIALDSIEGLTSLDWLVLDGLSNASKILENGEKALKNTLVIEVPVVFQPTHEHQPNLAELQHWASRNGFRFYRLNSPRYFSHLPESVPTEKRQATELESADAIFLPSHERMAELTYNQRIKLAFLLHTVYGIKDMAYELLAEVDEEKAKQYLFEEKLVEEADSQKEEKKNSSQKKRKIFIVGFPKSGTSTIQKALEATGYVSAHWRVKEGFVGELMYKGMHEYDDPWYYLQQYDAITQGDACLPDKGINCWPNLDFNIIQKIQEKYPDCLFILNYRDPKSTVSSIERWGDFLARLQASHVPGLYFDDNAESALQSWIHGHFDNVRNHFLGDDCFLEVDISDDETPKKIGEKLGVTLEWWGVANENKKKQTEFPLPDAPHMSPAERKLFKKSLKKAKQYFEFGSGGSTVWAVKEGLTVQGVESDVSWVNALKEKLGDQCQVEAVDIGTTKEWGFPVSMDAADKFPDYSQAISQHSQSFDLILIDGRFRVACTMSAILHVLDHSDKTSDACIFIHDFWNRPHYHVVLQFLETVEKVETAGLFKLSKNVSREEVVAVWEQYAKQPQ